jgi:phage shock protein A
MLVGVAVAQDPPGQKQQGGMMQHGNMMGMMQECRTHCRQMSGMHGDLRKTVEQARQSNDPVKMRAALDQVQKSLTTMEQRMSQCMRSMDNMEKMHGEMGGMMQHGAGSKQSESKKGDTKP